MKHPVRVVTAASLFDGHDATINIIRRMLQDFGAEVIHLGHNRSVQDVVRAVLQEGAQGVCVSSYQGGHMEYFKYMRDLLDQAGASYVRIFGGGGGVIIHPEKRELEAYGISQIFHPDDGRRLGLDGMIKMIIDACDFSVLAPPEKLLRPGKRLELTNPEVIPSREIGLLLTQIEEQGEANPTASPFALKSGSPAPMVLGVTGTGGAGKSSLIDELVQRFLNLYPTKKIAVVCVDPSKKKTGGSLLGDRIRMNSLSRDRVYMRSLASRGSGREIADSLPRVLQVMRQLDFDFIIAETSGIGQGNMAITEVADFSLYVMTSDFGAQSQLEKIDMIDFADFIAVNKADRRGANDALRDVSKQYRRSRKLFGAEEQKPVPVFLTQASQFNDRGVNALFLSITEHLVNKTQNPSFVISDQTKATMVSADEKPIIPAHRQNYLSEIVQTVRNYKQETRAKQLSYRQLQALEQVRELLKERSADALTTLLAQTEKQVVTDLAPGEVNQVKNFAQFREQYQNQDLSYQVRGKTITAPLRRKSLSGSSIARVVVPDLHDWGDRIAYLREENVPGEFPFTAGVFPLKRADEDPKRMFAGEGTPARTNRRFHFLTKGEQASRLSTAFDSVTLYGEDPDPRPDIFGKVGESGVSVCTLENMRTLYDGFDLTDPNTSVSMTINGPAPIILAFFFNAAIDQQVAKKEAELNRQLTSREREEVAAATLAKVRGTVQADILKEDQGQNTCIFSIQFALKMMGDIQQYFIDHKIRNFYSVSISGYHIAEAGANPISQLAFTLSNGFTFVEYYRARGMSVDEFAPNLSFFFSNGLDPEYTVLGRVARRIWAITLRDLYQADERSQKLKYHIQTSGRSLHAQEIAFNDIRTTLQAFLALADNCNSLHTNAYDEAITTPTEESVRRAMAIQLILTKEFGVMMCENPMQGATFVAELTEIVEEAVLDLFLKLNERGGVLGAMETQFQRSRIQEESLLYETLKHNGELPIIGVNTFVDPATLDPNFEPPSIELARASQAEKQEQLDHVRDFQKRHAREAEKMLRELQETVLTGQNVFACLMRAARVCSLGQMTRALFEVGGQYRRNV